MLKNIRITLASMAFVAAVLLFVDFTGTFQAYLGWLAKVQFLPAVLALNAGVVVGLILLTLIFGRIYCSVICPLGIMQDIIGRATSGRKLKGKYTPARTLLRWVVFVVFVALMLAGFGSLAGLLAPYSSFGRMAQALLQPLYIGLNNLGAMVAEHYGSYAMYERQVWVRSLPTLLVAAGSFIVVAVMAWRGGRSYCNTLCPVGTLLGFISRYSRLKITIDAHQCKNCRRCERVCKASCIDITSHTVDYSRCVVCGNCLEECKFGSIAYGHKSTIERENAIAAEAKKKQGEAVKEQGGRREFLAGAALALAATAMAQEKKKVDGGLAVIEDRVQPKRHTPLTPPGSLSAAHMQQQCTACQLCVSKCPNDVLRPSTDLSTFMQPTMSYDKGYCRPECNFCSHVCPTGAIKPITLADKSSTQIGHAVWVRKNCIPLTDGVACGNCARHCPAGAIQMVHLHDDESQPLIPAINEARCIGCGACEHLCPARPFGAIYVEGHEVHKLN